jgi:hypothetical protein
MKKWMIFLMTAAILAAGPAWAESSGMSTQDACKKYSQIAEKIMTWRQDGKSMPKMMTDFGDSEIMRAMIIDAYNTPRYNSQEYRQRSIENFRDEVYLHCITTLK